MPFPSSPHMAMGAHGCTRVHTGAHAYEAELGSLSLFPCPYDVKDTLFGSCRGPEAGDSVVVKVYRLSGFPMWLKTSSVLA